MKLSDRLLIWWVDRRSDTTGRGMKLCPYATCVTGGPVSHEVNCLLHEGHECEHVGTVWESGPDPTPL